jgi:hypothetical protein
MEIIGFFSAEFVCVLSLLRSPEVPPDDRSDDEFGVYPVEVPGRLPVVADDPDVDDVPFDMPVDVVGVLGCGGSGGCCIREEWCGR